MGATVENDTFADALGWRRRVTDRDGAAVELFRLCSDITGTAAAEAAIVARASRLSSFSHPGFASIRRVERIPRVAEGLTVVSAAVPGIRLSDLLRHGSERGVSPSPGAVRCLVRQISRAMADFHHAFPNLAHGTLGPERVVVGPDGLAVIVEHLLGPVLEELRMGRTALWTTFRVAVPPAAGGARFDQMTDVVQLGMLALALVLGRPIGRVEYPHDVERLLAEAPTPAPADRGPLGSPAMRAWLLRAFQLQARSSFHTAVEAAAAFEDVVRDEPHHNCLPSAVIAYVEAAVPGSTGPGGHSVTPGPPPGASCPPSAGSGPGAAQASREAGGGRMDSRRPSVDRRPPSVAGGLPRIVLLEPPAGQAGPPFVVVSGSGWRLSDSFSHVACSTLVPAAT
jgi:hypothetical protein